MAAGEDLDDTTEEISGSARDLIDSVLSALPRLGVALVIIAVGWALSRVLRWVAHRALLRRETPSFALVMSKLAGWTFFAVTVLVAIAVTFPSVQPVDLLAGLGFFSVAVGFAFQDILENTLAGVLLLFRQPFRSGDQIEVKDRTGTVEAITIRETRMRTFDGQLVVIPNRDVYKSVIRVQTHYPQRRMTFVVGIAYENDADGACDTIVDALGGLAGVADEPAPEAIVTELGASTVNIEARLWTGPHEGEALTVLARAIVAAKAALEADGVELPTDIVALAATPSFGAAVRGDAALTPGGAVAGTPGTGTRSSDRARRAASRVGLSRERRRAAGSVPGR
ncbi:MAG: mechanosensitive ion channel [Actinomycetota bacterium]|nr:mechanosensitive ion channel [Actinomycetota bacterium]